MVEELHAADDWPGRYAAVNRLLQRQARRTARDRQHRETSAAVREAWSLLTRRRDLTVAAVADTVGYSRRRLTQLPTAETGLGPKKVQRLAAEFSHVQGAPADVTAASTP
jgi:hypothetical protein